MTRATEAATRCYFCTNTRAPEQVGSCDFPGFEAVVGGVSDWECVGWICGECSAQDGRFREFNDKVRSKHPRSGFFRVRVDPGGTRVRTSRVVLQT